MSFQVQPAPRMAKAPMKNRTICQTLGTGSARHAGKRRRPPARNQQQPGADRTIETGEPEVGAGPGRRVAVDPVAGRSQQRAHSSNRSAGHRIQNAATFGSGLVAVIDRHAVGAERFG